MSGVRACNDLGLRVQGFEVWGLGSGLKGSG